MKVQILSEEVAADVAQATGSSAVIYEARENLENWMDEGGTPFAYELVLVRGERFEMGWWVHRDEVRVLTPGEELAALGFPHFSDEFAEEVLLFMVENDVSAAHAITIIEAKDISTSQHRTSKMSPRVRKRWDQQRIPYRTQGGITEI